MEQGKRGIALSAFLMFFIIIGLLMPGGLFGEEPENLRIQIRGFKIIGNRIIDIEAIRSKFKEMGLKVIEGEPQDLGIKERKEEEVEALPILFPGVVIEELEEREELSDKEFEELEVEEEEVEEEQVEAAPVIPEVTVEELEKKEDIRDEDFVELKVQEVAPLEVEPFDAELEPPPPPPEETIEPVREFTLQEIKMTADIITMLYQESGYMLAKAYIPKQEIEDGIVTISIIEGELGTVEVSDTSYYSKSYIKGWFEHLEGKPVKEDTLERSILLANDTPSLNVSTIFKRGRKPGTADVVLDVRDSLPVKLEFDYNNHGNPLVSRQSFSTKFEVIDPLLGSTLSLRGDMGNSLDDTDLINIEYQVPISHHGTSLGAKFMQSEYIVGRVFESLSSHGKSRIFGGYIAHPLIRSRDDNLKAKLGFDYKHLFEFLLNEQETNDDLSVAYARLDYDGLDRWLGKNFISLAYSYGFDNVFGSISQDDPVASRFGGDGRFDKIVFDYARVQRLWKRMIIFFKGSTQVSFNRLVSSEQFKLGGAGSIRGYAPALLSGDHGYLMSVEISSPVPYLADKRIRGKRFSEMFQTVIFVDHGGVILIDPMVGENKDDHLTSMGVGARINLFNKLTVSFDVGFPYMEGELKTWHEIVYIKSTLKVLEF